MGFPLQQMLTPLGRAQGAAPLPVTYYFRDTFADVVNPLATQRVATPDGHLLDVVNGTVGSFVDGGRYSLNWANAVTTGVHGMVFPDIIPFKTGVILKAKVKVTQKGGSALTTYPPMTIGFDTVKTVNFTAEGYVAMASQVGQYVFSYGSHTSRFVWSGFTGRPIGYFSALTSETITDDQLLNQVVELAIVVVRGKDAGYTFPTDFRSRFNGLFYVKSELYPNWMLFATSEFQLATETRGWLNGFYAFTRVQGAAATPTPKGDLLYWAAADDSANDTLLVDGNPHQMVVSVDYAEADDPADTGYSQTPVDGLFELFFYGPPLTGGLLIVYVRDNQSGSKWSFTLIDQDSGSYTWMRIYCYENNQYRGGTYKSGYVKTGVDEPNKINKMAVQLIGSRVAIFGYPALSSSGSNSYCYNCLYAVPSGPVYAKATRQTAGYGKIMNMKFYELYPNDRLKRMLDAI